MEGILPRRILFDLVVMTLALALLLYLSNGIYPYQRGFFCDDLTIKYPHNPSTVSSKVLHLVGTLLPTFTILVIEFLHGHQSTINTRIFNIEIPRKMMSTYSAVTGFLYGYMATHIFGDIIKNIIGRLRPCFIDICKPSIDCSQPSNLGRYILSSEFTCTSEDFEGVWDARKSFVSGHSTISAYSMLFLALYLQYRVPKKLGGNLVKLTLQMAAISMAIITMMTRVSDYRHHWSDVLGGMILGSSMAVTSFFLGTNVWQSKVITLEPKEKEEIVASQYSKTQHDTSLPI